MKKKIMAAITAAAILTVIPGCSGKKSSETTKTPDTSAEQTTEDDTENSTSTAPETTPTTQQPTTEHVSPIETLTATCGSQVDINKTIPYTEGSNTIKIPLADMIQEGDKISSFTFVIYSGSSANIGEFKGGCGISVTKDCPSATDEGWYQSENITSPTQGTYGEIRWDVPGSIQDYISPSGELLFGYWWGNAADICVESVICTYTRTAQIPVDGTVTQNVGQSVSYSAADNKICIPTADFLPENAVPQAVIYNISSGGSLGKFTGAFGYESSSFDYQSGNTAVFTDNSLLSLTWFVPGQVKDNIYTDGKLSLGYWWSEQPNITLDSVTVKYSLGNVSIASSGDLDKNISNSNNSNVNDPDPDITAASGDFRSSAEIVKSMNAGWNLGNTLDSYNTGKTGLATETGWGNLKTSKEMIKSVKNAGFNSIRIPVTWGEHMNGDTIDSEWLSRVKEVVDYAYDEGMFVILNMHHDDYIWFTPSEDEYAADSARLKAIWGQIAGYFVDYDDRLLFEGMNEPRTVGSANEWMGGTSPERAVIARYEKDFVETVRKSGGNNSNRSLIITSYAASAETAALNDVVVPNDKNIILSVHYYAPWQFSDGQNTDFGDSGKAELADKFAELREKFIDKGIPVIIGEFGCINAAPEAVRQDYYRYYVSAAKKEGIKCFIWDNNIMSGEQSFGIFNRGALSWNEGILAAIMDGTK